MSERNAALENAIAHIAAIDGISMRPDWLVEDLRSMQKVYGNEFEVAVNSLLSALSDVVAERVSTSPLKYELEHVRSYHFQSRKAQGAKADMRLAFLPTSKGITVISFGNRFKPQDFYTQTTSRIDSND